MSHISEELQTLPVIQFYHHYSGWTLKLETRLSENRKTKETKSGNHILEKNLHFYVYITSKKTSAQWSYFILLPSCMSSSDDFFLLLPPPVFPLLSGIVVDIWLSSVEWAEEIYNLNRIDFNKLFVSYSHLSAVQNLNISCFLPSLTLTLHNHDQKSMKKLFSLHTFFSSPCAVLLLIEAMTFTRHHRQTQNFSSPNNIMWIFRRRIDLLCVCDLIREGISIYCWAETRASFRRQKDFPHKFSHLKSLIGKIFLFCGVNK